MTQFLRPDGDITKTNIASGTFADIDEVSPSDSDFIQTNSLGAGGTARYECSLSNPSLTPGSGTSTVRYRAAQGGAGSCDLTASVYEGTTLIEADTTRSLGAATTYSWTPDLSAVSNFNNLRLRFDFARQAGSVSGLLSWAEAEVPPGGYMIDANAGGFAQTGTAATLDVNRVLAADAGTLVLAGADATLAYNRAIAADAGTFVFLGGEATLTPGFKTYKLGGAPRRTLASPTRRTSFASRARRVSF